jgi:hypothetical protein
MQGKQGKNAYFPIFELKFFLRAERKRSRAEPKIVQLGSDSSLVYKYVSRVCVRNLDLRVQSVL